MSDKFAVRVVPRQGFSDVGPASCFRVLARLPGANADYPYGQWSVRVEFWTPNKDEVEHLAWLEFLVREPSEEISKGDILELFSGTVIVAEAEVLVMPPSGHECLRDEDFLTDFRSGVRRLTRRNS